ncbi:hypothetical protein [uncultured Winogradskyella sp.]|uniref:hypothetical protein n=1 Tax=uncultured Winogradskyella sp. TaxID=395353 RepID=UPI0030EEFC07|tara:strand:- start:404 stop:1084 length:681 start_codon:yes stop_codon:yes gene_type:complete
MTEEDFKIDRFHETWESGVPYWFIGACLLNYNFKSFRRFLIYISHYSSVIDLRETPSQDIKNEEIIAGFQPLFTERIPKKVLYQITRLKSKTTFNEQFKTYFVANNLIGRKSFTMLEAYKILEFWQGEGKWGRMQAAKKDMLADIIHNGNYERTAEEFRGALGKEGYRPNLISPKKIKQLIEHIDLTEENQIEELMGYKELQTGLLWMFGIVTVSIILCKQKLYGV